MSKLVDLPANDSKPPAPVQRDFATCVRFTYFFGGIFTLITGLVFIGTLFNSLAAVQCQGPNCVGPSLFWGSFVDDLNPEWRQVFNLAPNEFVRNWTAVFMGIISCIVHWPGFGFNFATRSWIHVSFWNFLQVLFANFAYTGNLGILAGCFSCITVFCSLILHFSKHRAERTTLYITFGADTCAKMGFIADNNLVVFVAQCLSLGLGMATVVIGFIHVFSLNFQWCTASNTQECFGPSLRWNSGNVAFTADSNDETGWRSVFTFAPEIFFPLWGPVFLGWITVFQHLENRTWVTIFGSWPRVFLWFMFIALFANFGYSGSLGILVGFGSIFECFLALMITLGGGGQAPTHFNIHVRGLD